MAVKKIILKGEDLCIRKEGIATEAITPGDLVNALPNGDVSMNDVAAGHPTGDIPKAFAYENEVVGQDIDTDYAANDTILYAICPPGTEVWANGDAAITAGNYVEAATGGAVSPETTGVRIGRALTTTAGVGRVKIEVL